MWQLSFSEIRADHADGRLVVTFKALPHWEPYVEAVLARKERQSRPPTLCEDGAQVCRSGNSSDRSGRAPVAPARELGPTSATRVRSAVLGRIRFVSSGALPQSPRARALRCSESECFPRNALPRTIGFARRTQAAPGGRPGRPVAHKDA